MHYLWSYRRFSCLPPYLTTGRWLCIYTVALIAYIDIQSTHLVDRKRDDLLLERDVEFHLGDTCWYHHPSFLHIPSSFRLPFLSSLFSFLVSFPPALFLSATYQSSSVSNLSATLPSSNKTFTKSLVRTDFIMWLSFWEGNWDGRKGRFWWVWYLS